MPGSELSASGRRRIGVGMLSTAAATVVVVTLLAGLIWIVGVNAMRWFWPASVWRIALSDGRVVIGEVVERDRVAHRSGNVAEERALIKIGNRELNGRDHVWLDVPDITTADTPDDLARVTRQRNGDAYGVISAVVDVEGRRRPVDDRTTVERLVDNAAELRRQRIELVAEIARLRRPLTRLEHRLAELERSKFGATAEGRAEAASVAEEITAVAAELTPALGELEGGVDAISERLSVGRLEVRAADATVEVPLADVLDVEWPNTLDVVDRLAVTVADFGRFLVTSPRQANTEGGIYPALFGTVLLVLIMSLAVMPLGVLTAVYMTEYARPGLPLTVAHHAVNNLAGIPSIVIGIFGLTFFVYGIGGGLDEVFFSDRLPAPTFGTGGILWASLTLALLTVPVVVVATREGLLAVPPGWREGALALGATRWQTIRRIVLPAAMPGILTGLILAVGRAAGEVAPLMLTGAVKLAPSLPVDGTAPFVHLERKFMHLGFHIFDVSMQSPNVEAAKPMAFATTLVLLLLVLVINLTAIVIRRRLRSAYRLVEI
ncbi:MAG: phosphate ABC transporter permease PstA [Holophagae bacterium]